MWLSNHQLLEVRECINYTYAHAILKLQYRSLSHIEMSFITRAAARKLVKSTTSLSSSFYSALHKISGAFVGIATCNGAGITSTSVE